MAAAEAIPRILLQQCTQYPELLLCQKTIDPLAVTLLDSMRTAAAGESETEAIAALFESKWGRDVFQHRM